MSNGSERYNLTTKDWVDMNREIQELKTTTQELRVEVRRMNDTSESINTTLSNLPCRSQGEIIEAANRRSQVALKTVITLMICLIGGLIGIAFAFGGK